LSLCHPTRFVAKLSQLEIDTDKDWNGKKIYNVIIDQLVGSMTPSSDSAFDIGSTTYRWRNVRAVNVYASSLVQVGDLVFANGWRFVEDEMHGIILISPDGRKYRLRLEEVLNEKIT